MYQCDLKGHLFETHIQWNCSFTLLSFAYGMQQEEMLFVLFMERVYVWLPGELFHRPRQRQEYHADVMKSSISSIACALRNSTKVVCSCIKNSQLKLSFSSTQHSLGGWRRHKEESITVEPLQLKVQGHGVGLVIQKFLRKLE